MTHMNLDSTKDNRLKLRKEQTDAERKLWSKLRNKRFYDLKFFRQSGIGNYIADFYCPEKQLVIEVDGSQHWEETNIEYDRSRTEYFEKLGIQVLRFPNIDVLMHIDDVLEYIFVFLEDTGNIMISS